ncbi:Rieske 2Fe-2S domain-containing protein [Achromobacter xylosoxidans]|uniref:Rieske 2Fe-2S domain-containing protein n=1 Tax=Alcaligenes xylosoxydans xylosoxydans TaxID=85698 RepID=UPI001F13447D|nr:Rieske 2Fe-2S domain-containing protein [Achromobacter xylosoxidans]
MTRQFVCQLEDVPKGTMKTFELEGEKKILIINADQNVFACQGVCPHQDVCLEEGLFDGEVLTCHQHLWQWKVASGEPVGLAEQPLEVYEVEVEDGSVFVEH